MRTCTRRIFAIAAITVLALPASAQEVTDFPRVVVTGQTITGSNVICRGMDCAIVLESLDGLGMVQSELLLAPTESGGFDKDQFCKALEARRPAGCDASDPPSTPGLDPGWQPNGCGTGGASNLFLNSGLGIAYTDNYSGDFNAPFAGTSFKSACDAHDGCWGSAGNRSTCDSNFHNAMRTACTSWGEPSRTTCNGFAAAYFSAVAATDIGNENYRNAVNQRRCALWAHDMRANGCGE